MHCRKLAQSSCKQLVQVRFLPIPKLPIHRIRSNTILYRYHLAPAPKYPFRRLCTGVPDPVEMSKYSESAEVIDPATLITRECKLLATGHPERIVSISLLPVEAKLLDIFVAAAEKAGKKTVVRVAGGWVRDKLLHRFKQPDIDVALDNVTGKEFAETVVDYLKSQGEKTSTVAIIQANPEQSKHLETATTKILNLWIDFVNLRAEVYGDSRIPRIEFGTPQQDAERRDFTMNSLFYNVTSNVIEDFCGRGFSDLQDGLLRTPISPMITFVDDPLRVLRAVRFASRFGFKMVEELHRAASDPSIHAGLDHKVSRERIGNEVELMLNGPRPIASLRVLASFGLLRTVFSLPEGEYEGHLTLPFYREHLELRSFGLSEEEELWATRIPSDLTLLVHDRALDGAPHTDERLQHWHAAGTAITEALNVAFSILPDIDSLHHFTGSVSLATHATGGMDVDGSDNSRFVVRPDLATGFCGSDIDTTTPRESLPEFASNSTFSTDSKRMLCLAAMLYPLQAMLIRRPRGRLEPVVTAMITDRLKRRNKEADDVYNIIKVAHEFRQRMRDGDRLQTALCFRNRIKGLWREAVYLAFAVELLPALLAMKDPKAVAEYIKEVLRLTRRFVDHIIEWKLPEVFDAKPLVDGKRVMELTGARGAEIGPIIEEVVRWQLLNPDATPAQAEAYLKETRATAAKT